MDIAARIIELRKELGWSQHKIAERSGLSQPFISDIESGKKQPTLDSLLKLSDGLGISLIDFISGEDKFHSLPPHLATLLTQARHLTPSQVEALNHFIQTMTGGPLVVKDSTVSHINEIEEEYGGPTAANREDNPMDDLPTAAQESVIRFKKAYIEQQNTKKK
jgi:transcriptional regulator with XRE-family HTH domain